MGPAAPGCCRSGLLILALAFSVSAAALLRGCAGQQQAEEDGSADATVESTATAPMEEKERRALFAAIESFVGEGWNGSGLYPDPCGWSPIQGVSCDLFNGLWYPTVMSIGPVLDNSLQCAPDAKFSPQLGRASRRSLSVGHRTPPQRPVGLRTPPQQPVSGTSFREDQIHIRLGSSFTSSNSSGSSRCRS